MIPELQQVLQPTYLEGVVDVPTKRLREMRVECTDLENGTSYVRRLAQGRLDLLVEESRRRAEGGGGDLADLIARLPELLSDEERPTGSGRIEQDLDPPDHVVGPLSAALDAVVGPSVVAAIAELGDDELSAAVIALRRFEDDLSTSRRTLHSAIDTLNDELARRITAGEAPAPAS